MNGLKWARIQDNSQHDTVIIVCTGPSLKNFDFSNLNNKGFVIAVNDAGKFVPSANAWFTLDPWGCGLDGTQPPSSFHGQLFAAVPEDFATATAKSPAHQVHANPNIKYLHRIPFHTIPTNELVASDFLGWGLSDDASCIHTGNSGYGALNLAYHMRPKRIILLGLDASKGYFYDEAKSTRSLNHLPAIFESTLPQLNAANIEVINGSPTSMITCFERCNLSSIIKKLRTPA